MTCKVGTQSQKDDSRAKRKKGCPAEYRQGIAPHYCLVVIVALFLPLKRYLTNITRLKRKAQVATILMNFHITSPESAFTAPSDCPVVWILFPPQLPDL